MSSQSQSSTSASRPSDPEVEQEEITQAMDDDPEVEQAEEPEPVAQYATIAQIQQWAADDHDQACKDAKEIIQQLVPAHAHIMISKIKRCSCGCPIVARQGMSMECVVCKPQHDWSDATCDKIKQIVGDTPTLEQCRELVMQECENAGYMIVGEAV